LKKDLNQIQRLCDKLDGDIGNGFEGSTEIRSRIDHIDEGHDREEIDNVSYININL
jgi:hypothetical protein